MSAGGVLLPNQVSRVEAVDDEAARLALGCPGDFNGLQVVERDTGARFHCVDLTPGVYDWVEVGGGGGLSALLFTANARDVTIAGNIPFNIGVAGTIVRFSAVNNIATTGSFGKTFSLRINNGGVSNGDVTIPSGALAETVFTSFPTADNVLTLDDVLTISIDGGSGNSYGVGFTVAVIPTDIETEAP